MDKEKSQLTMESIIDNWNEEFTQLKLKSEDLIKPHLLMEAVFLMFEKLGIDRDFVLAPPEDCSESAQYYWDLLPIINMTRIVNHLLNFKPEVRSPISIMHFLQPTQHASRAILVLLMNFKLFTEERLAEIAHEEEALFAKTEHVKSLESRKNKLLEMLNEQAVEQGMRVERLEKLRADVKQLEEELKQDKELHSEERQHLEPLLKENHQMELLLDQKRTHRDALLAEVARKKALRVYDADDVRAQVEQSAQNVQEAEEKLTSLRATLMQKESSLNNLQTIKPSLDTANNLLREIMKLSDTLRDFETGDLDSDSKDGELEVRNTELSDLQAQLSELHLARVEAADKHRQSQARRQDDSSQAHSALHEAQERDKKCRERCKLAALRTDEIKLSTARFEEQRAAGMEELADIKEAFCINIKSVEDMLTKKLMDVEKEVEEKLQNKQRYL